MRVENLAMLSPDIASTRARLLGSYYTPDHTAEILAQWAIRSGHEVVLEPSAGAGALVRAALNRARQLTTAPECRAIAFDIDDPMPGLLNIRFFFHFRSTPITETQPGNRHRYTNTR